jgi:hypothetical protein
MVSNHHSSLTSSHNHHHPSHHRDAGSNNSTDSEEGLGGSGGYLKDPSLPSYDSFTNTDPDSFLNTKPHHSSDLNNNSNTLNNSETFDGLDIIADDMSPELDITKHTQDAPMHKLPHMGGLLNTHMLISPRHLMNV